MNPATRSALTSALSRLTGAIAADLRQQILAPGPVQVAARALHRDERVGEAFEVWSDLLARRAAVLWVLKSVYVRVLEDRGLLAPARIVDVESQHLFEALAPNLGESGYLRWVYTDLAVAEGGLPELFALQPAEVALPADALTRQLLALWRDRDADTGLLRWRFDGERFDGELMGDLYQELDPVVKERFALLQTPAFVRDFILDQTLTPATAEWGADTVRVLDPACGSGHFLLEAFRRLVEGTAAKHPDWSRRAVVLHVSKRVVGIDLNDYAGALARARLAMTAAELAGETDLAAAGAFHPQVFWADGLEQVEKEEQLLLLDGPAPSGPALTQPQVRAALRPVLKEGFHVVVANPPYITEKDEARKAYHREKVGQKSGKSRRYVSAYREYSLASPFTERCFQLARADGYVGLITSNNFMKREFGKALIEEVLAGQDLFEVIDTSGAYIPGHGTPTVLLFARHRKPAGKTVRATMGKRGEPSSPPDPAQGKVWSSIRDGHATVGFETEYVSVAEVPRETFGKHPWSLGGGGAAELKEALERRAEATLAHKVDGIGLGCMTRADEIYFTPRDALRRAGVPGQYIVENVEGGRVRDWALDAPNTTIFPYRQNLEPVSEEEAPSVHMVLWPYRTLLWLRREPNGNHREIGLTWWEWSRFQRDRYRVPLSIAFAFVATHNHFVLDRGGKVFNRTAPVIKLPAGASEDDHLALLGLLNSSTACFWMKQVCHDKGSNIEGGQQPDKAKYRFEFSASAVADLPLPELDPEARFATINLARQLDGLAAERARALAAVLRRGDELVAVSAEQLRESIRECEHREAAVLRRQIILQEELDWRAYVAYGLVMPDGLLAPPKDALASAGVDLGARPFEILAARRGRTHGLDGQPLTATVPPDLDASLWERRIGAIERSPELALIEDEAYKRRWLVTPKHLAGRVETFQDRLQPALRDWLADRLERAAEERGGPATARQLAAGLQADPRVNAIAEVYTGRRDFDLEALFQDILDADSVPNHPFLRYSDAGLVKRAAWEETWALQRREDAGEAVTPPVPPAYAQPDFRKAEWFRIRGKLDVPKERFVAFTEVPGGAGADVRYGWAGWTPKERVKALLAMDEEAEDAGVPLDDRLGILDSAWRLLPDVVRDDPEAAGRYRAEIQALVGEQGPSPEQLSGWKARFAAPRRGRRTKEQQP